MSIIQLLNEERKLSYDTEDDLRNLIYYIFNICKTSYDGKRPGHMMGDFCGCARFLGTPEQELRYDLVSDQMIANNRAYGKRERDLIKHRVISFRDLDLVRPDEAYELARYIANAYGEKYMTAYGVHLDTEVIHIHLAVDTIGWQDGKRFSVSYELKWLQSMVGAWEGSREAMLEENPKEWGKRLDYYGTY